MEEATQPTEEKKNDGTQGIEVHDIIVLTTNGHKYDWYNVGKVGLVTRVSAEGLTVKYPDGEEFDYFVNKKYEDGVWYTISRGSELEYKNGIKKALAQAEKKCEEAYKEKDELSDWLDDFENSISFIGKLKRFVKGFSK